MCPHLDFTAIAEAMTSSRIPYTRPCDSTTKSNFNLAEDTVKIVTMHSSKRLEFPTVAMCGVGHFGRNEDSAAEDARLLKTTVGHTAKSILLAT
jgi:ATP-dependent exoDNAse (exonuclease V) beta subunit